MDGCIDEGEGVAGAAGWYRLTGSADGRVHSSGGTSAATPAAAPARAAATRCLDAVPPSSAGPVGPAQWVRWKVADESGFEVEDAEGLVCLRQINRKQFDVLTPFRFSDEMVQQDLVERLRRAGLEENEALRAVEDARTFSPCTENPTDLASIPAFVRWFENSYGRHTLAAILHDNLIVREANAGALKSDTLSDRFFREMLRSAGVPWLKRWFLWAAVAVRTRWAARGPRRASLGLWMMLAVVGIASFISASGSTLLGWDGLGDSRLLFATALVLPFASGVLWGRQFVASIFAAVACICILPAAAFALLGLGIYYVLEFTAGRVELLRKGVRRDHDTAEGGVPRGPRHRGPRDSAQQ